jgi:hypothetical protein
MTEAEVNDLRAALAGLCQAPTGGRPLVCPDCFVYDYEQSLDSSRLAARFTDGTLPGSPFEPIVQRLTEIISAELQLTPASGS